MSFGIYLVGFLVFLGGLVYALTLAHMPSHWIVATVVILAGLGIVKAVTTTRPKDST